MNYYEQIKKQLINNEINRKVKNYSINRSDLNTYYNVGKMLSDAGKHYGERIINKYSSMLINDVDKKYNTTTLKRMRQFYWMIEKGAPLGHQLSWSHYRDLLPIKDINEVDKKYNRRTLFRMRQFYTIFSNEKVSTLSTQCVPCMVYN